MTVRVTMEPDSRPVGLKGLGAVATTDALGPGAEQATGGEIPATVPAASDAGFLGELAFVIALALLVGYLTRDRSDEEE